VDGIEDFSLHSATIDSTLGKQLHKPSTNKRTSFTFIVCLLLCIISLASLSVTRLILQRNNSGVLICLYPSLLATPSNDHLFRNIFLFSRSLQSDCFPSTYPHQMTAVLLVLRERKARSKISWMYE
jgi:hypothetical protein